MKHCIKTRGRTSSDNPTTHLPKVNRHDCPLAAVAALYGIGTLFV
ncbi:hypothetical protein [Mediterranea massiliensis]|nr:hypothetical protein [Mediterranea massiliensis]